MAFRRCKCGEISVCEGKCAVCIKYALDQLKSLTKCSSCHGEKIRWYALYGMGSCQECRGTGNKSGYYK